MKHILLYYNIVSADKIEVTIYGLEYGFLVMANILFAILISILLKTFVPCILFITLFIALRRVSGGFHASHRFTCFIYTQFTTIITSFVIKMHLFKNNYSLFFLVISAVFIMANTPKISKYKNFNSFAISRFRKSSQIITIFYFSVAVLCYYKNNYMLYNTFICVLCLQALLLLIPEREHAK